MNTIKIKQEIARDLLDHLLDDYPHTLWKMKLIEKSTFREIKYTVDTVSYDLFFHLMSVVVRLDLTYNKISLQAYHNDSIQINVMLNDKLVDYYKEQLLKFTNFSSYNQ